MPKPLVSIVIVNWNGGALLLNCIQSVLQSSYQNYEIIIVDNASNDQSIALIPKTSQIHIISNKTNMGFAYACNQGASDSKGEYILFLNPDTQLLKETLTDSVDFMECNTKYQVLGVKNIDLEGNVDPSCGRLPKPLRFVTESFRLSKLWPNIFLPATLMNDWDHLTSKCVEQVIGAYFFIRRKAFNYLDGFDSDFFVYYEEVDLCKRLKDNNNLIFYNSKIVVKHVKNGTTSNIKDIRLFYSLRSRLQYSKKHFRTIEHLIVSFFTLFVEPASRILYFLLKGDISSIKESVKGYKLLYISIFE